MNLNEQIQNSMHKETLDCVLISLTDIRLWDRDATKKNIKSQNRRRKDSIKLFLNLHPLLSIFIFFVIYVTGTSISIRIFFQALIFLHIEATPLLRSVFFILILLPYIFYSINLKKMIPKSPVGYNRRWFAILTRFLSHSKIIEIYTHDPNKQQYQEAKRRLNTSIRYYKREGEVIKFYMTVIGSGILMGTLASKEFQVALYSFSTAKVVDANPLGSICLTIFPFIFVYYIQRYYLPIAWMQQIVDQIEWLSE